MRFILLTIFLIFLTSCQSEKPVPNEPQDSPAEVIQPQPTKPAISGDNRYPPAPNLPAPPDTLKIAVISDINGSYGSLYYLPSVKAAVQNIIQNHYDFVVSPGDLVAGQKHGLNYDMLWKTFHYEIGDVFFDNNLEFIFAPGNHDASAYPGYEIERMAFARAFENRHPRAPLIEGSHFPFYYGVIIRDVRVIALDITRPIHDSDPQLDWLENVLNAPIRPRATIVLGHLPLSPVNLSQFWEVASSQRLLRLLQHSPNTIYISGHHHIYYPGHIGELRTIAAPALGAGARSLLGAPPVTGFVQITIPPQAPPQVTALVAPDFTRMIDIKTLPAHLVLADREDTGMAEYIMEMMDNSVNTNNL